MEEGSHDPFIGSGSSMGYGVPMRRLVPTFLVALTGCVSTHPMGRSAPPVMDFDREPTGLEQEIRQGHGAGQFEEIIGRSVEGRPLRLTYFGRGPRWVLWIGGIHGDEREGAMSTEELGSTFLERGLGDRVTLAILEDVNPDGTERNTRRNARGVDLNRNYPAANFDRAKPAFGRAPLSQPESRALHDFIQKWWPDLVVVCHSWRGDHFINHDGPARALAARFASLSGYRVRPSSSFAVTPGSLGSWIGNTLELPILTLEYERGADPLECWQETKEAILAVIEGS